MTSRPSTRARVAFPSGRCAALYAVDCRWFNLPRHHLFVRGRPPRPCVYPSSAAGAGSVSRWVFRGAAILQPYSEVRSNQRRNPPPTLIDSLSATSRWPSAAAAGKTGTSDDYRDAWFAGYTPAMACTVWVGKDDNSPLPGTGASLAAPLWARFMRAACGAGIPVEKGTTKRRVSRWRAMER